MNELIKAINELKKEKNAIILGHYYQKGEIQDIADYVGDSLALAQWAAKTEADIIVMCGVHFMGETAKVLCPDKKVLVPDMNAGCSLADSCPADQFAQFVKEHPGYTVISYVNPMRKLHGLLSTAILPQHLPNRMKHIDFYIKIIVVVPFIGYDSKWPDQSKHRLKKLIQNANDSIVISHSADVSSYKKRNYYMVDHAEYLIGVFDNQKKLRSGTAQTVNYALHQGKVITLIHPDTMEITAPAP